jgi:hypothetical protein
VRPVREDAATPGLTLNTAKDIASQMYRRFVTRVGVLPGRVQFIGSPTTSCRPPLGASSSG